MEEKLKTLPIAINGAFKNLNLKIKYERDSQKNIKLVNGKKVILEDGLDNGEYIILKKGNFVDGIPYKSKFTTKVKVGNEWKEQETFNYLCKALYDDGSGSQEVSFFLTQKEHDKYVQAGGMDDSIKVINIKQTYVNKKTGDEVLRDCLEFIKV